VHAGTLAYGAPALTAIALLLFVGCGRKVRRRISALRLAAGRDGRPTTGERT